MVFTSQGRAYWLKVYEIPEASRVARGRALVNLLQLKEDEKVTAILPVKDFPSDKFIFMTTKAGVVKKTELSEFANPRKGGLIACSLDESDTLIGTVIVKKGDDVLLATSQGMSIRFPEDEVRAMGRTARGVFGIRCDAGDYVVGMCALPAVEATTDISGTEGQQIVTLLTVCERGYGKRTELSEYRVQGRGGKGLIDIQTGERNGTVVAVAVVSSDSEVMLITSSGKIIRTNVDTVRTSGRNTMGVKLIDLETEEQVVALAHILEKDDSAVPNGEPEIIQ